MRHKLTEVAALNKSMARKNVAEVWTREQPQKIGNTLKTKVMKLVENNR